eukprot:671748_1
MNLVILVTIGLIILSTNASHGGEYPHVPESLREPVPDQASVDRLFYKEHAQPQNSGPDQAQHADHSVRAQPQHSGSVQAQHSSPLQPQHTDHSVPAQPQRTGPVQAQHTDIDHSAPAQPQRSGPAQPNPARPLLTTETVEIAQLEPAPPQRQSVSNAASAKQEKKAKAEEAKALREQCQNYGDSIKSGGQAACKIMRLCKTSDKLNPSQRTQEICSIVGHVSAVGGCVF